MQLCTLFLWYLSYSLNINENNLPGGQAEQTSEEVGVPPLQILSGTIVHVEVHPDVVLTIPSSHSSFPALSPSPQCVSQTVLAVLG